MSTGRDGYTVGEVARAARVTVRTLHHYDAIGLLSPSGRTAAGYRTYTHADLERLQRIRCYRETGLRLTAIAAILDDPGVDPLDHLRRQHAALVEQHDRLAHMIAAVQKTMEARRMGINLSPDEMFEVFGDEDPTQYADEVEQRWGDTDAYQESQRRTSRYTKADWQRVKDQTESIEERFAAALRAGEPADGETATALAEEHRRQIDAAFYPVSYDMHRGLAEMYVTDARFTRHYDEREPGLAAYVHAAIVANADRREPPHER